CTSRFPGLIFRTSRHSSIAVGKSCFWMYMLTRFKWAVQSFGSRTRAWRKALMAPSMLPLKNMSSPSCILSPALGLADTDSGTAQATTSTTSSPLDRAASRLHQLSLIPLPPHLNTFDTFTLTQHAGLVLPDRSKNSPTGGTGNHPEARCDPHAARV